MKTSVTGPVRVRFAPSPTGFLHVGGARTAIYNELLRENLGGSFILRIEDTDAQRSDAAMIEQICSGLRWIGVQWDEGPFLQSDGLERHQQAAQQLLEQGKAFRCFRTSEEIEAARSQAQAKGETLRYRDFFAPPSADEEAQRLAAKEPFVVRFRCSDDSLHFSDLVRGEVEFPAGSLDDFVILRSDGSPTYHLSVVCDDVEMRVTHVIRGDDHLSNTPKHVDLFRALGAPVPVFVHLPLILGSDKKRLSKRTGATSVEEFRDQGFLPQALYNALGLLGWSPGGDREIMSRKEMVELFTVERINSSAAIFDRDKLSWLNAQYMSSLSLEEVAKYASPFLAPLGLDGLEGESRQRLMAALELHRSRAKTLEELGPMLVPYFQEELVYVVESCQKFLSQESLPGHLEALAARFAALEEFSPEALEQELRQLSEAVEVKAGVLIHPTRMALTASKKGPSLFELVATMGREATGRHLANFVGFLGREGSS
ncbi:MAG: glutamate--tRNA ligase [Deltaproteobacteria bacterium]|nr:glutamate--tRNA ligase [Deltaproteobacteria bacterium]